MRRAENAMMRIEFEEPTESMCECCGDTTVRLTRFVYKDGYAYAVYYAQFTAGHEDKRLSGLVGLGEWGEGAKPENRLAFPFQMWTEGGNLNVGLVNAEDSPWRDVTFLGRLLSREEAIEHAWVEEVFHLIDHMVREDKAVMRCFDA